MTTVATFIDSARFDLRDYQTGLEFDDDELVEYINRMARALDSMLTSLSSSYVHSTATLVVADPVIRIDARSLINSGNWDSIRSVWIGNDRLEKIPIDHMYYKNKFNHSQIDEGDTLVVGSVYEITARTTLDFTASGAAANTAGTVFTCTVAGTLGASDAANKWNTGRPYYWAQEGEYIVFELATSTDYVFTIHYNKRTATLTTASSMPYNDQFNEVFRELLVMHAKAKKEGQIGPSEQVYQSLFRQILFQQQIRTDRVPKYYKLDF